METLKVHKPFTKSAWWKSVRFSVNFIKNMKTVNTLRISKEKALQHYVNLIVKVFQETFEITPDGRILNAN